MFISRIPAVVLDVLHDWRGRFLSLSVSLWPLCLLMCVWMWFGVVWCSVVCGVVWCGVVWCGVVWRGVAWRGVAVWCGVVVVCGGVCLG